MSTLGNRPWFKFWPEGVPRHIDYPEIPLFGFLSDGATQYPDNIAFSYREHSLTYDEQKIFKRTVREYYQKNVEPRARNLLLISDGARWISDIAGC